MRRAWPGVRVAAPPWSSGGEQLMGGLRRRSALPRRSREIPFVAEARGPKWCDDGGEGPPRPLPLRGTYSMEETRRPPGLSPVTLGLMAGGMPEDGPPILGRASDDNRSRLLEA